MSKPAIVTPASPAIIIDIRKPLFLRLDANGAELQGEAKEGHAITHFPQFGLMFDVRPWKTVKSLKLAQAHAKKCDLLGRKGDWIIPERAEAQLLFDPAFADPAVNPLVAPNAPSSGWVYTATKTQWSSDLVWFVLLSGGGVDWGGVDNNGLAVPCLRVPPSQ